MHTHLKCQLVRSGDAVAASRIFGAWHMIRAGRMSPCSVCAYALVFADPSANDSDLRGQHLRGQGSTLNKQGLAQLDFLSSSGCAGLRTRQRRRRGAAVPPVWLRFALASAAHPMIRFGMTWLLRIPSLSTGPRREQCGLAIDAALLHNRRHKQVCDECRYRHASWGARSSATCVVMLVWQSMLVSDHARMTS